MTDINERIESIRKMMQSFNEPYKQAVAINCYHIGDDNDYSCFLSNCVYALWLAGEKERAWILNTTDPMRTAMNTVEEFEQEMEAHKIYLEKEKETELLYYKHYVD